METTAAEEKQPSLMSRFNDGNLGEQEGDDSSYREVSLHPMCWLISCPIFHCGLCPYRTGRLASKNERDGMMPSLLKNDSPRYLTFCMIAHCCCISLVL
jgi:hypothetical protein